MEKEHGSNSLFNYIPMCCEVKSIGNRGFNNTGCHEFPCPQLLKK